MDPIDPHKPRAIIGLVLGFILLAGAAVAIHFYWKPSQGPKWVPMVLPGLLLVAWGSAHLSQHRGYSSVIAYALCAVGFTALGLTSLSKSDLAIGFGCVLAFVLPVTVLFTLPKRPWFLNR